MLKKLEKLVGEMKNMSMFNFFVAHPWLRGENPGLLLDFSIYKLVKSYIRASPFRRAALKVIVVSFEMFQLHI